MVDGSTFLAATGQTANQPNGNPAPEELDQVAQRLAVTHQTCTGVRRRPPLYNDFPATADLLALVLFGAFWREQKTGWPSLMRPSGYWTTTM